MLVYITIGLLIAILMFTSFRLNKKIQLVSFFSIGFILFLLSAFRSGDISRDYIVYIENYKQVITNTYSYSVIEPFFVLLSKICYILTDNYLMIFFSYAFLGISIKLLAITKSSNSILASLLLYYSNYFFLHEMTQIRVGVASAIFLLSIRYIVEKKIYKYILFVLLAATFHYSALLALPLYFLNPKKLNKYHIYLMFGSALTIYLLRINITNILFLTPASGFLSKVQMYKAITDETGDKVNIFNILFLINLFFNLYLLHFKDTLAEKTNISSFY